VIPKSSNPQRIRDNSDIFDFKLSEDEMERMHRLDTGTRYSVGLTGYMVNPLYVKLMKLCVRRFILTGKRQDGSRPEGGSVVVLFG